MTLRPETVNQLRDLVAAGLPVSKAAASVGICRPTAAKYVGRDFQPVICREHGPDSRSVRMAAMYQSGMTLEEIGRQYGVTRERVRQIIKKHHGLNAKLGGIQVRAQEKRRRKAVEQDAAFLTDYGCTKEQWREIRDLGKREQAAGKGMYRTPLYAFRQQRQAAKTRGIGWELSLWQWWSIWRTSGHWEQRGRGQGYVMCRKGDSGPYAVGNVFIATARENIATSKIKKSSLPMGVSQRKGSGAFVAHRSIGGKALYLGTYPTPEAAHAAYLAADPTLDQGKAA